MNKHNSNPEINPDKAGEEYWTHVWKNTPLPKPFIFDSFNINEYPNKVLHKYFKEIFKENNCSTKKLLEIGCGNSVLLSYFAKEYGFEIYGIDYSKYGCEQSRKILERDHLSGTIIEADAFNPPPELLNNFDVVCSFGVVEHFVDTASTLKKFSNFCKPGGKLITSIPNLSGATGFFQKWLNKPVYDIHVPMDKEDLNKALREAGLKILISEYFLAFSISITFEGLQGEKIPFYYLKKVFIRLIRYGTKLLWFFENIFGTIKAKKMLSAGIITSAQKL